MAHDKDTSWFSIKSFFLDNTLIDHHTNGVQGHLVCQGTRKGISIASRNSMAELGNHSRHRIRIQREEFPGCEVHVTNAQPDALGGVVSDEQFMF